MIDAVVTWVDGADKAHLKKRLNYFESTQAHQVDEEAALPTRFASNGEIDYCLRALLKFAPWLRKIFIITDGQTPSILKSFEGTANANRFQLIDHRDIFRDYLDYLPIFNSLSIESMLWRIPDLSEHFIYLNDDCFLLQPLAPGDFFQAGKPVLRGSWKTQTDAKLQNKYKRFFGLNISRPGHRIVQENSARLAGFNQKLMHLPHVPFPLLKQTFVDFFEQYTDILLNNAQHALRHPEQFWPISLAYHLNIKQNKAAFDGKLGEVSVNPAHHTWRKIQAKLKKADKNNHTAFACIQSLDQATPDVRNQLIAWLDERIL
ncbi:MAG: Stealth CR1 domain-containing protein [Legionella sp.]|nr:Stealth CR1 domain-containing protein [Legionella sp.]